MSREETIFEQALGKGSEQAREEFLRGACADDRAMFERLHGLLLVHDRAGKFLEYDRPADAPRLPSTAAPTALYLTEKPGDRIGRYKLLQKIGEGGCRIVYMADQEEPVRRRVALKIIKLGMDTRQVIARFEAERQALALMDHPNIAKVHDAGATDTGRPYFVMELVRGVKITEYCDERKLATQQRLQLFMQVCRAVQHAHQKGIIHRDLKPSNILVSVNDGAAVPKVIDFGIAKATTGEPLTDKTVFTAFEQFIGTPAYMSPEQALVTSLDIDTRTDIYSLGVLLYELLTGQTPFDSKELLKAGLEEMRRTICEREPVRPSTRLSTMAGEELSTTAQRRGLDAPKLLSQLRGDLDWIVMGCLEKDRARRYETANGLASDIQRHLNNEPVLARPPSSAYRLQKFARRNKLAFVTGATLMLLMLVAYFALLREARRADASAAYALAEAQRADALARAESEQRNRAEITLNHLRWQRAEDLFTADQTLSALAHLARVLREQPTNHVAANRLISALTYRNFAVPVWGAQHGDTISSMAFSPDGQLLATASSDKTVRFWDVLTGRPVLSLLEHPGTVQGLDFNPDGTKIATVSDDAIRLWDTASGRLSLGPIACEGRPWATSFSPDGRFFANVGKLTNVFVRETLGKTVLRIPVEGEHVNSASFAPNNQHFVTIGNGSAEYSPNGQWIVTTPAANNPVGWVWDLSTGTHAQGPLQGNPRNGHAVIWDALSGRLVTSVPCLNILPIAPFSPDSQRFATVRLLRKNGHWLREFFASFFGWFAPGAHAPTPKFF